MKGSRIGSKNLQGLAKWLEERKKGEGRKERKQYHAYGKVWNLKIRFKMWEVRIPERCKMQHERFQLQNAADTMQYKLQSVATTNALSIPCQNVQISCQINVFIFKILHDRFQFSWASKRYTSTKRSLPLTSCIQNKPPTRRQRCALALAPQQQQFSKFDPYTKMFYKFLPIRMSTKVHNTRNVKILYSTSKM